MDKLGCEVTSQFFKCKPCSKPASGFFDTKLGVSTINAVLILSYKSLWTFGESESDRFVTDHFLSFLSDCYVRKSSYDTKEERRHHSARDDSCL